MQIKQSLLGAMRESNPFVRAIASTVIITFSSLILSPTAQAVKQEFNAYQQEQRIKAIENSPDALFSRTLQSIKENIHVAEQRQSQFISKTFQTKVDLDNAIAGGKLIVPKDVDEALNKAKKLHKQIPALKQEISQSLKASRTELEAKQLPEEIMVRHDEFVTQFDARFARYEKLMEAVNEAETTEEKIASVKALDEFLSEQQFKRSHQEFDPSDLPVNAPDGNIREPVISKEGFKRLGLNYEKSIRVASLSSGSILLAQSGNAPNADDLQPTEEIIISDEIRALANSLGNDSVDIFNWVRNNVDFMPTYASIQGSEMALGSRQGNAFDTSSLLIALLRAAGIHSRYVYGTVEIPVEKVMNWVGGVSTPEAAMQLLGQGGIPNTGLASGGKIMKIRMEHMWVEAWIDYLPSKGAKHREGDSWVAMDASFKQYIAQDDIALDSAHFDDAKAEMERVLNTVNINQADGYIQGLDQAMFRNMLLLAEQGLWNYEDDNLQANNQRVLQAQYYPVLASGLPYKVISTAYTAPALPESAKHSLSFKLYSSRQNQQFANEDLSYQVHYSELAGKELKLGFVPASDQDRQTLLSYFSDITPGQIIQADQLPDSIPGYLIQMKPVLTLDGLTVAEGSAAPIGTELFSTTQITRLNGSSHRINNSLIVGESAVLRLSTGAAPANKEIINVIDRNPNRVLQNVSTSYFGHLYYALPAINALNHTISVQHPSVGTFATEIVPEYYFGLPRNVKFGSMRVDLDIVEHSTVSKTNDAQATKNAVSITAMMSSMLEGEVPVIFGASESDPAQPVSAMHAIAQAISTGQKIYTITGANQSIINSLSIGQGVKTDIRNAINAGREVIVPEANVLIGDWVGTGYVINDPLTGAGIYRISSGLNGGGMSKTEITMALSAVGLASAMIVNAVIPVANADTGSCELNDDSTENNRFNWQSLLAWALLLTLIIATIAVIGGSAGGLAAPALKMIVTVMLLFSSLNKAYAAGKGCPVYTIGSTWTSQGGRNWPIQMYQQHVQDAIASGITDQLIYVGGLEVNSRGWYRNTDEKKEAVRLSMPGGEQWQVDEYPFNSVLENVPDTYPAGLSLRVILAEHNQGGGHSLNAFYRQCNVSIKKVFLVKIDNTTSFNNEDGSACVRGAFE